MSRTTSATWAACVKVGVATGLLDPDRLGVDERLRAEARELAAVAGVLGATERDLGRRLGHLVDVDHAALDLVGEALLLRVVLGPGAAAEAERGVVGDADGVVDVGGAEHQRHGPEQLLVVGAGVL